jgi:hypothetical protein
MLRHFLTLASMALGLLSAGTASVMAYEFDPLTHQPLLVRPTAGRRSTARDRPL